MLGKLKGQIDSCFEDHVIIDVAGVGYLVYCSLRSLHKLEPGEFCQLFIETHVRQDHINLYGFLSIEEKNCFNILQSVAGIGPRLALGILSVLQPEEIANAVAAKDKEMFRAISGVGPKMAERILVELKGKLIVTESFETKLTTTLQSKEIVDDAVSALANLGISRVDAQNSVVTILNNKPGISINELIRIALKDRAQR